MDPTEQLGDLLIAINKAIKVKIERDLKSFGIGMGQLQILVLFYANDGQTFSQNELVRRLGVDKGNISRSVTKLFDKAFLEQDHANPRACRLSEKGRRFKDEITSRFQLLHQGMTQGLDERELEQTTSTLNRLLKNLEAQL